MFFEERNTGVRARRGPLPMVICFCGAKNCPHHIALALALWFYQPYSYPSLQFDNKITFLINLEPKWRENVTWREL